MNNPLFGAFHESEQKKNDHMLGPVQKIDAPMRHYPLTEEVDFCIVGVGSAGGVLLQRLARPEQLHFGEGRARGNDPTSHHAHYGTRNCVKDQVHHQPASVRHALMIE